jgi:hypothetical protein
MRRIVALSLAGVIVLILVVAQFVLPGIAADRLRDRLSHYGTVLAVHVDAFPAIKLLWHSADKVMVRMGSYHSSAGKLGSTLAQASDAGSVDASAQTVQAGLLTLRDATLRRRGGELSGNARVSEADLRAAIPILQSVQPVASGNGQLTLRGTATLLGITASIDATVSPQNGTLVVQPDVPLGGLATITVFANPHLEVQSVSARPAPGGFAVSAIGRLH